MGGGNKLENGTQPQQLEELEQELTNFQKLKAKFTSLPNNLDFQKLKNVDWKALRRVISRYIKIIENHKSRCSRKR